MSGLTDFAAPSREIIKARAVPMSNSKGCEGLSPHLPSPFRGSASVQTSPKGITHRSKPCDVYHGDHREIRKLGM